MSEKDKPTELEDILRKRKELDEIIDTRFKRPATVLFTDIVGSTTFFSTRGDIEGQLMIQRHNDLLLPLLSQYQGTLIEIIGDAIFGSFEEPSKAVACAVKMQETLAEHNQRRPEKDHIRVRIGINMGTGYVEGGRVRGIVVNIAERVKSLADAYQILISEPVYQSLQPGKDPLCTFLDKVRVKGVEEEIKVYQVIWRGEDREVRVRGKTAQDSGLVGDLVLEASRENNAIKVSVYENSQRTLRFYESIEVNWEQIERDRREVIALLNRANRRAKVTRDILDNLKKSGQALFDLLIPAKARETISTTDAKNLLLYVDDRLVHIPWELLFDGRQFLCRRFAMGRMVSTRQPPTSLATRTPKAPFKVLVIADPRGDLEASYREGIEIKNFLDEKREMFHLDFKSRPIDVPFVKKNLRDYDLVHYAGHADYHTENPSESGWLLKDGRLKASEISAMGGLQPMPSLVFSNSCQSGHSGEWQIEDGYEQQIFGLANAYLLSGVQHYIGTFWEILDEPSCFFAKRFYSFLAQGVKVGEAVRRARLELIDAYGEETIVWATYMLYGDPTFEFALAEKEVSATAAPRDAKPVEWPQVTRGEERPKPAEPPSRHSPYVYPALGGLLLLLLGYFGYRFFSPAEKPEQKVASVPAPVAPISTPPAMEQKTTAPEKAETKTAPAPAEVTTTEAPAKPKESAPQTKPNEKQASPVAEVKTKEKVKVKEPTPAAPVKSKEVAAAPAARPQETSPLAPIKEEVAVVKEPAAPVTAAPLRLSMNIIGQRKETDGSYTEIVVSEGSVLRSGDNFQIHLETSRPAYVAILMYDSQGKASQIFPDSKATQSGSIQPGSKVVVPARDLWFWLDESTGTETIYVLASEKPLSDIQGLLAKMESTDDAGQKRASQQIKERIAVMQRGVGGIVKGNSVIYTLSDGKKIQKVTDVVTGTGSVVRAVSFQHR